MRRIRAILAVLAVAVALAAGAAPAMASRGGDDFDDSCFPVWSDFWWTWVWVCDDDGFRHDGFDDGDHHDGGGNSGPG
jgi:hypothetical protein